VITELDGQPTRDPGEFRNTISLTPIGCQVQLTVLRSGKPRKVKVTIGNLSEQTAQVGENQIEEIGLAVQNLPADIARQLDATPGQGIVVSDVRSGSIAAEAGITRGTIILLANGEEIHNVDEFSAIVAAAEAAKRLVLLVRVQGSQRFVALSW
jgi:serine protease Do